MTHSLKKSLRRSFAALAFLTAGAAFAQTTILNVSYDVSRELFRAQSHGLLRFDECGSVAELRFYDAATGAMYDAASSSSLARMGRSAHRSSERMAGSKSCMLRS